MKKFFISGPFSLRKAFVEECGLSVYDEETLSFPTFYNCDEKTKKVMGCISIPNENKYGVFSLPVDWNEAVEYVKKFNSSKSFKEGDKVLYIGDTFGKVEKYHIYTISEIIENIIKIEEEGHFYKIQNEYFSKNFVVEILGSEHAQKVEKFFVDNGYSTGGYNFIMNRKNGDPFRYYGTINKNFNNYDISTVNNSGATIFEIPEEKYNVGNWVKLCSERPSGWSSKGLMDEYLGKVVKIIEIFSQRIYFYPGGEKFSQWTFQLNSILRKATDSEIKKKLIKMSIEKGFKISSEVDGVRSIEEGEKYTQTHNFDIRINSRAKRIGSGYYYNSKTDTLYNYGYGVCILYENGIWAKSNVVELFFGKVKVEVHIKEKFVETEYGRFSEENIKKVVSYFEGSQVSLGKYAISTTNKEDGNYNLELNKIDKPFDFLKIGCEKGKFSELKEILKTFDC